MGTRKKAFYRIVVADQRTSRDGRFIELLGTYDPRADPPEIKLDTEKAQGWLAKGAQPSDVVRSILVRQGILEKPAITYTPKTRAVPVEAPAAPEAAAPEAAAPEAGAEPAQPEEPVAAPEAAAAEEAGA